MHTSVRHMGRKATRAGETLNEGAGNPVVGYQVATIKYCRIIGTRCEQVILDKSYTRLACVRCPVSEPRPIPNSRSHSNVGHQRLQSKVNQQLPSPLVCRSLQLSDDDAPPQFEVRRAAPARVVSRVQCGIPPQRQGVHRSEGTPLDEPDGSGRPRCVSARVLPAVSANCAAPAHALRARLVTFAVAEWAASKIQSRIRGNKLRKQMSLGGLTRQAQLVNKAKKQFKRYRLEGALVHGDIWGQPVNPSIQLALSKPPDDATCYEHIRTRRGVGSNPRVATRPDGRGLLLTRPRPTIEAGDASLRFFIRYQNFFLTLAAIFLVAFVIDILVIIFAFWGAVFGSSRGGARTHGIADGAATSLCDPSGFQGGTGREVEGVGGAHSAHGALRAEAGPFAADSRHRGLQPGVQHGRDGGGRLQRHVHWDQLTPSQGHVHRPNDVSHEPSHSA